MKKTGKKLGSIIFSTVLCFTMASATVPVVPSAMTANAAGQEEVQEIYRLFNRATGEHFYTAGKNERNNLRRLGWVYEGVGWIAPVSSNTPVYRLYNPNAGDHHYTTDSNERDRLVAAGWNDEAVGWYSDDGRSTPIYREYNPNATTGSHNFTSNQQEHKNLSAIGWHDENIGWYCASGGYEDVNSDYGYTTNTRTKVTRSNGNTSVTTYSVSSYSFSYSRATQTDVRESLDIISDMLDYLEEGEDYVSNEAVCSADTSDEAQKIASMYGATVKDYKYGIATLALPSGKNIKNVINSAENNNSVKTAIMPQYIFKICDTNLNDPYIPMQWQHDAIGTKKAWDTTRGAGAKICIIDTGCDLDHPDLAGNIKASATFVRGTASADDDNGHGTHVTGIAAGVGNNGWGGAGIAPEASLYIAKAGDSEGYFDMSAILSAMNWAIAQDVDVVNMSFAGYMDGATASYYYGTIMNRFKANGITLVAGAGNDSTSYAPYPAALSDAISVAASSDNSGSLASFSNYGSTVDIVAPGDDILSTYTDNRYAYLSGTSMASPAVTGAVALIYASDSARFGTDDANAVSLVRNRLMNAKNNITYRSQYGSVTGGLDLAKIFDPSNDNYTPSPQPTQPQPTQPTEPTQPSQPQPTQPSQPQPTQPDNGYYWNYGTYICSPSMSVNSRSGYGCDITIWSSQNYPIYVDVNGSGYQLYTGPLHYNTAGTYTVSCYCSDGKNSSSVITSTCSFS